MKILVVIAMFFAGVPSINFFSPEVPPTEKTETAPQQDVAAGEKIFKNVCTACHSIGGGKRVGPDLNKVHMKYDEKWLISFIRSSQTMVKSGDAKAVKAFNENNKIIMPDNKYTDAEIKNILAYIKKQSK